MFLEGRKENGRKKRESKWERKERRGRSIKHRVTRDRAIKFCGIVIRWTYIGCMGDSRR
jgi:hypothetical protein